MTPITAGEDRPPAPAAAGGAAPSPAEVARAAASSVRAQAGPTEEAAGQARPVAGAHEDPARAVEGQGKIRVVVAKPGLDGHDRGAKIVARALRDAGMEVIYTGLHQTPEQIVETALQEDADGIGLSVLSGAHMTLFRRVLELLHERDAGDVVVFGGGIIPDDDIPQLEQLGVAKVFTPGASTQSIIDWVRTNVRAA
jgi:methylmalonyl-CoA mutase C-terminal domain/subunit